MSPPGADARTVIVVISGGTGASGEQLVNTVLAQFPTTDTRIVTVPLVRDRAQVVAAVDRAAADGGLLVHTLVDRELRRELVQEAAGRGVAAVDLMGDLIQRVSTLTGEEPLAQPGLYRRLRRDYFARMEAIEFAIAHDDGQNRRDLPRAEIVLLGVSRAGKTPLSMYLAMQGWLAANVPLVPGLPLPEALDRVDRRRVVGLAIDYQQLISHREKRHVETGLDVSTAYTDPARVMDEIEACRRLLRQRRIATVDVTAKPIESSAREVVALVTRRLGEAARRF
ncbi:MAG: pyruvate, water dikinase regulatory protein [Candidatus Krumholzibacteriia bacterium]